MLGGPLAEDRGFILHTPPSNFASSIRISDNTVMTTSRDVLETLGTDKQPSDVLVALGYASWRRLTGTRNSHNAWRHARQYSEYSVQSSIATAGARRQN